MNAPDLEGMSARLAALGGRILGPVHLLAETTSTNDEAKHGAKGGSPHGAMWIAESQTAGRGRQGRAWTSPRGENLLFSMLLRVTALPARVPLAALVAGLAVHEAIARRLDPSRVKVKWPNDVWIDRKKVCGILVESVIASQGPSTIVVGIGVNVHSRVFPDELANIATSLALAGASDLDRGAILADIVRGIDRDMEHVLAKGLGLVHARLLAADGLKGTRVVAGEFSGLAEGIDLDGKLELRGDDGILRRVSSGEVHLSPDFTAMSPRLE